MTGAMPCKRPSAWHVYFQNIYFDQGRTGGGQLAFKKTTFANFPSRLFYKHLVDPRLKYSVKNLASKVDIYSIEL